ncbi:hypothetical protein L198_01365 [Cryptococcus wingfieldii CBS 7118]|uniref:Uncharacterized protein n=1 Tax=Cryptococcus wingfieldii CBS 7118 TaxID=1295528 RepID=A0A1E3JZD0_9TREE|nr:hypothetical protein L198_01365 [Cryptococcus wingfieldii CBS 7118]ODO06133.1 hypothetical protein L198_01365 [Cryptococcus wingfieldii CBS 7118]
MPWVWQDDNHSHEYIEDTWDDPHREDPHYSQEGNDYDDYYGSRHLPASGSFGHRDRDGFSVDSWEGAMRWERENQQVDHYGDQQMVPFQTPIATTGTRTKQIARRGGGAARGGRGGRGERVGTQAFSRVSAASPAPAPKERTKQTARCSRGAPAKAKAAPRAPKAKAAQKPDAAATTMEYWSTMVPTPPGAFIVPIDSAPAKKQTASRRGGAAAKFTKGAGSAEAPSNSSKVTLEYWRMTVDNPGSSSAQITPGPAEQPKKRTKQTARRGGATPAQPCAAPAVPVVDVDNAGARGPRTKQFARRGRPFVYKPY